MPAVEGCLLFIPITQSCRKLAWQGTVHQYNVLIWIGYSPTGIHEASISTLEIKGSEVDCLPGQSQYESWPTSLRSCQQHG